jgi:hypothetical protein
VQAASASTSYKRRKNTISESSITDSEPRSINDLPDEMLLKILSHFGPEDLCLKIAKVCERWNNLSKDVALWRNLSYSCEDSDISEIAEVRCTTLLRCRTNYLTNFVPSGVLKVQNLKEHFKTCTFSHPD